MILDHKSYYHDIGSSTISKTFVCLGYSPKFHEYVFWLVILGAVGFDLVDMYVNNLMKYPKRRGELVYYKLTC